ncbi:MAG TPA: DUF2075 domain-containing protein [Blastocatellia bacterium]|nr:DUF2075 domain-containing protein [Blastocatellia bacterium]
MSRFYYHKKIEGFLTDPNSSILGELVRKHEFPLKEQQKNSWSTQIILLKQWLQDINGDVILEYSIPRMGKRIDCIIISGGVLFAIEFKVGAKSYENYAIDQVIDYALDLKNFQEQSHNKNIIPILICTAASEKALKLEFYNDGVAKPILSNGNSLPTIVSDLSASLSNPAIDVDKWLNSIYKPTPTIIEAAQALYRGHSVEEISRSDAGAINLSKTAKAVSDIIERSKVNHRKSICFLTGVPGAGKTLAGLNLANSWHNEAESEHAVFLSGNGPLVEVLREALARNEVNTAKENGNKLKKSATISKAKAFIQNIHHFRDDALNMNQPPLERVVIFDEAQRAWTLKQTASFMKVKKGMSDFNQSEPEFLIGVMNRHTDWATIICLIGGGQEINTGEAGLHEWFNSLRRSFLQWDIHISSKLIDFEYTRGRPLFDAYDEPRIYTNEHLHLSVSVRSYRSEKVASFVKSVLDLSVDSAKALYAEIHNKYPIYITRDLQRAKNWLRSQARGSERYGLVASSGAIRLKALGINVKSPIDPKNWFLNDKEDIRSSYFLEDVATEFVVQGLELDWACVAWDADLRHNGTDWSLKSFRGTNWQDVNDSDAAIYLKNAYRVLLTRARQGMVILVPYGSEDDHTRQSDFYDKTFDYLRSLGIIELRE